MIERITVREFFTRVKSGRYVFPSIMEDIPLRGNEKEIWLIDNEGVKISTVYSVNAIDGVNILINGVSEAKQILENNGFRL